MKYLIGIGVLLCAWIIAASIPQNETLKGMDILSRYLQDSMLIFRGEIAAKGGLIGAFLVSLCTFLFDYKGTWIIVIALLILALILLLSGSGVAKLKTGAASLAAPFVSMRKNHAAKECPKGTQAAGEKGEERAGGGAGGSQKHVRQDQYR